LNKILGICEAHEEVRFSSYLSQVNTTEIKISRQRSEVAHNFSEKKKRKLERFRVEVKKPIYFLRKSGFIMD